MLTLPEQLFLLTIHDENGTILSSVGKRLAFGLEGAQLAELAVLGKIRIEENNRITPVDENKAGTDPVGKFYAEILESRQPRKIGFWMKSAGAKPNKLRRQIARGLIEKQVITEEDDHYVWVIPYGGAPNPNASAKFLLKSRLREIALACAEPDTRELALLSLLRGANLLELAFTRDERKAARRHIRELLVGKAMVDPVAQEIEEIEAAVDSLVEAD